MVLNWGQGDVAGTEGFWNNDRRRLHRHRRQLMSQSELAKLYMRRGSTTSLRTLMTSLIDSEEINQTMYI